MLRVNRRLPAARPKRVAALLTIAQLGYAQWFFGNLYEAVVRVPDRLAKAYVPSAEDQLDEQHRRALELGATLLHDRSDDEQEPLRVYADPAGHPFCIFVVPVHAST